MVAARAASPAVVVEGGQTLAVAADAAPPLAICPYDHATDYKEVVRICKGV
ncbi:hypothetical protein MNEG_13506, partial [Monoraphidium neglectum]